MRGMALGAGIRMNSIVRIEVITAPSFDRVVHPVHGSPGVVLPGIGVERCFRMALQAETRELTRGLRYAGDNVEIPRRGAIKRILVNVILRIACPAP